MSKTPEEILASIPSAAFTQQSRFAPKLDFAQRCEVLAFYRSGISRVILAKAYNIDRRTVTHMANPNSPHYHDIRREWERLGPDEFKKRYITEEGGQRVSALIVNGKAPVGPSPQANKYRGINMVKTDLCKFAHRVEVEFFPDGHHGPGWYYRDLDDSQSPDDWFYSGDESLMTSKTCLEAAKEMIADV